MRGCRDSEVLSLVATIINKLQSLMEAEVPRIFEAVFEVTLTMITKNFEARTCPPAERSRASLLLIVGKIVGSCG